jgi:O-antigen/teichoic acid export membrane protein
MRTYQATDLNQKYQFSEYGVSRVISCAVMFFSGVVYSICSFSGEYIIISVFVILMKTIDAVEDVYHGNFQQKYHVEMMGKMLAVRNIYSTIVFVVLLFLSRDLKLTCVVSSISSLALCLVINSVFTRRCLGEYEASKQPFQMKNVGKLLGNCTPLFVGTFLSLLLYNIPKYAMAGVMSDEYQTYYSVLFMPSFVITLMCEFVFKPMITTIAELWWKKEKKQFILYNLRIMGIIAACCALIVLAGHLLGRRLLELIYGVDLSPYKLHFVILLIGGGIGACVYMMYNILIAIRKGGCIILVYGIVAVLTILPAKWMIEKWNIMGAALNYLFSCSLLFLLFGSILTFVIVRMKSCRE